MRRFQLLFTLLQVPIDFVMIVAAFMLAYWARLAEWFGPPVGYVMPVSEYLNLSLVVALAGVIVFALAGLYRVGDYTRPLAILTRAFIGVSIGISVFIIILFGAKESFFSRLIAGYAWVFGIVLVAFGRWFLLGIRQLLKRASIIIERVVVIGGGRVAEDIVQFFKDQSARVKLMSATDLGVMALSGLINRHTDQVIVTVDLPPQTNLELINFCENRGIRFRYFPSPIALHSLNTTTDTVMGYPLMELRSTPLEGWGRIAKRIFDFVLSGLALIILAPLMWIVAIIIRLDSKGPALFIQKRPGLFGKDFNFRKFRSMYTHLSTGEGYGGEQAEAFREQLKSSSNQGEGLLFKVKDDPRVTRIGKWLRRTSLDELPQLFNVINGEMSLVGPRPPLPDEVAKYDRKQFRRLLVKPGLTGLWQVSGRSDASFDEYVRLDTYYIEHWSLWLDIQIIIKTVWVALTGKGAY